MRCRGLIPLAAALALAGCGGGAQGPAPSAPAPPPPATGANTVTISALGGSTGADETGGGAAVFPAATPSGVLDLAAQHPEGSVAYATAVDGVQGELVIARLGTRAMVTATDADGTTRVGVDLRDDRIAWVCETPAGGDAACSTRDADGRGADALALAARLIGDERLRQIAASAAASADARVEVRTQAAGVDASCVSGSGAGGAYLLCVSPSGFVTTAEGDGLSARALGVEATATAADVERPQSG